MDRTDKVRVAPRLVGENTKTGKGARPPTAVLPREIQMCTTQKSVVKQKQYAAHPE